VRMRVSTLTRRKMWCFTSEMRLVRSKVTRSYRKVSLQPTGHPAVQQLTTHTALDEAMDAKDADALTRLYRFCEDCDLFELMVKSLRTHIEVS
jgi:hypothetical protein